MSLAPASVRRITGLAVALAAFGAGCASPVSVERDPLNDFARYRTWAWLPSPAERTRRPAVTPQLEALVRVAIANELAARGFVRAPAGEPPDFLVGYELGVRTQISLENEVSATQTLQSFHGGRGDVGGYEIVTTRQRIVPYEIGVVALDVIDTQQRALVWRGIVSRRARERFSSLAGATIAEILEQFPSPP